MPDIPVQSTVGALASFVPDLQQGAESSEDRLPTLDSLEVQQANYMQFLLAFI